MEENSSEHMVSLLFRCRWLTGPHYVSHALCWYALLISWFGMQMVEQRCQYRQYHSQGSPGGTQLEILKESQKRNQLFCHNKDLLVGDRTITSMCQFSLAMDESQSTHSKLSSIAHGILHSLEQLLSHTPALHKENVILTEEKTQKANQRMGCISLNGHFHYKLS